MAYNTTVRKPVPEFMQDSQLQPILDDALNACYAEQPSNAGIFMAQYFARKFSPSIIGRVEAVEQLDASCGASLKVRVTLHSGQSATAMVSHSQSFLHPSSFRNKMPVTDGKSDKGKFAGLAESGARAAEVLTKALAGRDVNDQRGIDEAIKMADGTTNLASLGTNITSAVSAAIAQLAADAQNQPLFLSLAPLFHTNGRPAKFSLPTPVVTLFSAEPPMFGKCRIREVCILPHPSTPLSIALRQISRVTECAIERLAEDAQAPALNTDGSIKYVSFDTPAAAIDLVDECVKEAGLVPGQDIFIGLAIDGALCHKAESGKYAFMDSAGEWTGAQLAEFLATLAKDKKSLVYLEDTHNEKDTNEMRRLMARVGNVLAVCGSNTYCGDVNAVSQGAKNLQTNTLALKLNDSGTITEMMSTAKQFVDAYPSASLACSAELVEQNAEFMADMATAMGAAYFRCGGLLKQNHCAGYNRLAEIEAKLKDMGILAAGGAASRSAQPSKSATPQPGASHPPAPASAPSAADVASAAATAVAGPPVNPFSYRFEHVQLPPAPSEPVAEVPLKDAKKKK